MAESKQAKIEVSKKTMFDAFMDGPCEAFVVDTNGRIIRKVSVKLGKGQDTLASQRIEGDAYDMLPSTGSGQALKVAKRPFDANLLALAAAEETYHGGCIDVIVENVVSDFSIQRYEEGKLVEGDKKIIAEIERVFTTGADDESGPDVLEAAWTDYEGIGEYYLQVIRTKGGEPAMLGHLPAQEMRIVLDVDKDTPGDTDKIGYVQTIGSTQSLFRKFNDNSATGGFVGRNDVLFARRYTSLSYWHGIPKAVRHWGALVTRTLISEYNQILFYNEGVPKFLVLAKGPWPDGAEVVLKNYLTKVFKGQHHKIGFVPLPEGCSLEIVYLIKDQRDASFLNLDKKSRDEILHSYGVPPQMLGIVETGALGGNVGATQFKTFKAAINRKKRKFEGQLNRLIDGVERWKGYRFCFSEFDVEDEKLRAEIQHLRIQDGVISPAQAARELGYTETTPEQEMFLPMLRLTGGIQPEALADQAAKMLKEWEKNGH